MQRLWTAHLAIQPAPFVLGFHWDLAWAITWIKLAENRRGVSPLPLAFFRAVEKSTYSGVGGAGDICGCHIIIRREQEQGRRRLRKGGSGGSTAGGPGWGCGGGDAAALTRGVAAATEEVGASCCSASRGRSPLQGRLEQGKPPSLCSGATDGGSLCDG
ncbi:hypothetical protein Taro_024949, partial [Colocasia esculenta]|nr:hypothetical protein [Colocasia esculenta]